MWSSNCGHEREKGGNFINFYDGIKMIFSGYGRDLLDDFTFFLLHILGHGIGGFVY